MKILFIGGTGRLSKDVAKLAADYENEVYLLTRGTLLRKQYVDDRYHMIYGNIRDVDDTTKILEGYSFAAVIDFITYNVQQLENTLDVIDGRYNQYIFISTATVYKRIPGEVVSEDRSKTGNDKWDYARNKYLCEKKIEDYFKNRAETYTIIRPGVTYGNTRIPYPIITQDTQKEYSFLYRILHDMPIPVYDDGNIAATITHTRDFAKGVVGLMGNKAAYGQAFHITSDEKLYWGDVLDVLEAVTGKKIVRLNVSQEEIYKEIPYYKDILLGDKGVPFQLDNTKILKAVEGLSFDVMLSDGLRETVENMEKNSSLQLIDYKWMGEMDRLAIKQGMKVNTIDLKNSNDRLHYMQGRYKMIGEFGKAVKGLKRIIKQ